jgi:DNA-binding LytR/AlgR family response regulator
MKENKRGCKLIFEQWHKELEDKHKSFLVNVHYIRKFMRASESYGLLKSGGKIPVSVRTSAIITLVRNHWQTLIQNSHRG